MKIHRVEIIPVQIPLVEPFVIAIGATSVARTTFVKIHTEEGIYGIGECCPFRTIHTESQEQSVVDGKKIAAQILHQNPLEIHRLVGMMDKALPGPASIKAAFDIALHDLAAKAAGMPLYLFLGGDRSKDIYTDMTISLLSSEEMAYKAVQYLEQGFTELKVKLGEQPSTKDVARIAAIRKAVGMDVAIRIDANLGWDYGQAYDALRTLEAYNIQSCEAPLPADQFSDLKKLKDQTSIPIMGDETVFSPVDAYKMLSEGHIDKVNIKLGKAGGIHHATSIAAIAQAANAKCQVGCFSETRLGLSALAHFSLAWDHILYHDMDSSLMHAEDPIIGGISFGPGYKVEIGDQNGHGADLNPDFLKSSDIIEVS